MRSQFCRRRRWNIDKRPKNKMQKEKNYKNLEVLELLNDEQRKKQRSDEREDVNTQFCFIFDKRKLK